MAKINDLSTPYPVVDADPHAGRVIRYMRPSDYVLWAGATAAAPGAIYGMRQFNSLANELNCITHSRWHHITHTELADPTKLGRAGLRPTLKLATWLGFCGGFLLAYQTSSRKYREQSSTSLLINSAI